MSQHDYVIANASGAAVRTDLNLAFPAIQEQNSGTTAPTSTFPYMFWADTTNNVLKQRNGADNAWIIVSALRTTRQLDKSANYTVAVSDYGAVINCTGSFTLSFTAAATLGANFWFDVRNLGTGLIILDPATTETIDGNTTFVVIPGETLRVYCDAANFITVGKSNPLPFKGHIDGCELSNNAGDAAHIVDVAAGVITLADNSSGKAAVTVEFAGIVKDLGPSAKQWVVGTGNGGLDGTESVAGTPDASTWYHVWMIRRSDTGVVDVLFSESATAPTMPGSYDQKRRIGAVLTDVSANILAFTHLPDDFFQWDVPILDVDISNTLSTSRRLDALSVPLGFKIRARFRVSAEDDSTFRLIISSPDETDAAPSASATPLSSGHSTSFKSHNDTHEVYTNASAEIASRSNLVTVDTYRIVTLGWFDPRGRGV